MTATAKPTIFFDLDGTVYPLYQQENWLDRITTEKDATVYAADETLVPADELMDVLCDLLEAGYSIGVISWLPNGIPAEAPVVPMSPEYAAEVRAAKREWVKKFLPMATEIHMVRYGTPKHRVIRNNPHAILVDDNAGVRSAWCHGLAIDPTKNLVKRLRSLL